MQIRRDPAAPLAGRVTTLAARALVGAPLHDPQGHEWYFAQPIAEASSA